MTPDRAMAMAATAGLPPLTLITNTIASITSIAPMIMAHCCGSRMAIPMKTPKSSPENGVTLTR